jgi:hypothetical protein
MHRRRGREVIRSRRAQFPRRKVSPTISMRPPERRALRRCSVTCRTSFVRGSHAPPIASLATSEPLGRASRRPASPVVERAAEMSSTAHTRAAEPSAGASILPAFNGSFAALHAAYSTFLVDAAAVAYLHHLPGACCVGGGHSLRSFFTAAWDQWLRLPADCLGCSHGWCPDPRHLIRRSALGSKDHEAVATSREFREPHRRIKRDDGAGTATVPMQLVHRISRGARPWAHTRSSLRPDGPLSDQRQQGLLHLPFDRFEHRMRVCGLRHRGRFVVDPIVDIRMILAQLL